MTRNTQVRWYSTVQGSGFTAASLQTANRSYSLPETFRQGNGGIGYDCSHSIYDNESDVGAKIQSAW